MSSWLLLENFCVWNIMPMGWLGEYQFVDTACAIASSDFYILVGFAWLFTVWLETRNSIAMSLDIDN